MNKKLLIEQNLHQTRVAVLEDDTLTELFVERSRERGLVGNVYKGRVTRVLPGMEAAFVNIGLERDAFLYAGDVAGSGSAEDAEELDLEELQPAEAETPSIDQLLRQGQELVVQVLKDPLPNKGARITTHVTLPGRYLVYLPTTRHFAVSRRIEEEEERQRLLDLIQEMAPATGGLIVRTVSEGEGRQEFERDLAYLEKLWQGLRRRASSQGAPALLHRDLDLALRTMRDAFSSDFSAAWVEGQQTYENIREFLDSVQPSLVPKVRLYQQEEPLFQRHQIDEEMEAALRSKVWLKSGGYIVIHPTEALVAIDVNTGRFVGEHDFEDTVLQTNLEAIREVVRQIRLRDLGGIIVLDLIDMLEQKHRDLVFSALEQELRKDRAKNKVLAISEFGLVELTRKRSRTNLERLLTQPCPYCRGRGRIKSVTTICLQLRQELLQRAGRPRAGNEIVLRVHPEVARALQQEERPILDELELALGAPVVLQSEPSLHHEQFEVLRT